jgi:hypothetical protein
VNELLQRIGRGGSAGAIVAVALAFGWVGEGAAAPAKPSKATEKKVTDPQLTWSLEKAADGKSLSVSFDVKNITSQKLYVADRLVKSVGNGKYSREDKLMIMTGDDPRTMRFILGAVSPDEPSTVFFEPTYVGLAPGESLHRTVSVPLPLTSYNPMGAATPPSGEVESALLSLHFMYGEPAKWITLDGDDGTRFKVPEPQNRRTVRTPPLKLPR